MELVPIKQRLEDNEAFTDHPDFQEAVHMTIDFFNRIGYNPPWIGYYVKLDGLPVGAGAFKGKPVDGRVEIAYGTFPQHQNKGVASQTARELVKLALATDPSVTITARTLAEENFSARILRKNNFKLLGTVIDPEDGELWEWEYEPAHSKPLR